MQALAFYKSAPAHLTKNQEAGRAELARSLSIQYLYSIYIISTISIDYLNISTLSYTSWSGHSRSLTTLTCTAERNSP